MALTQGGCHCKDPGTRRGSPGGHLFQPGGGCATARWQKCCVPYLLPPGHVTPIDQTLRSRKTAMSKVVFGPSTPVPRHSPPGSPPFPSPCQSEMSPTTWARHVPLQITPHNNPSLLTAVTQDQLIDVFKSVGQVVGFRCVSDQLMSPSRSRSLSPHLNPTQSRV